MKEPLRNEILSNPNYLGNKKSKKVVVQKTKLATQKTLRRELEKYRRTANFNVLKNLTFVYENSQFKIVRVVESISSLEVS